MMFSFLVGLSEKPSNLRPHRIFSRRRLVLELMAFNDLRCSGSRACRVAQLRQMRQDLKMLAEQRDAAGLLVEGAQKSLL